MAQSSSYWDTGGGVGDGADTYSSVQNRQRFAALWTTDKAASEGVIPGYLNQLAVSGATSPLSVATGAAWVNGLFYRNESSAVSVSVTTPSSGTTGGRVVLQALWSAQTVRVALLLNTDGSSGIPALTQSDNSRWEIPLASFTIDTGGAITLTDTRDFCHMASALIYRRRGGSSSDWSSSGSTGYTPGGVFVQSGARTITFSSNDNSDNPTITFPQAYAAKPLVSVTLVNAADATLRQCLASVYSVSKTSFQIIGQRANGSSFSGSAVVLWRAIGPKV